MTAPAERYCIKQHNSTTADSIYTLAKASSETTDVPSHLYVMCLSRGSLPCPCPCAAYEIVPPCYAYPPPESKCEQCGCLNRFHRYVNYVSQDTQVRGRDVMCLCL